MPTFKGFTKSEDGQTLAVVDFPDARKFKPAMVNGAVQIIATPNPHEEELNETQFRGKFNVGFEALPSSFPDEGFDLGALAAAADARKTLQKAAPRPTSPGSEM